MRASLARFLIVAALIVLPAAQQPAPDGRPPPRAEQAPEETQPAAAPSFVQALLDAVARLERYPGRDGRGHAASLTHPPAGDER
ncbi:MAG TPA: hypothetical protein VKW76_15315 [Candidatus Binatia bacterium]|nr:hypothetical protein [Candidatus Binatia bacterium]